MKIHDCHDWNGNNQDGVLCFCGFWHRCLVCERKLDPGQTRKCSLSADICVRPLPDEWEVAMGVRTRGFKTTI